MKNATKLDPKPPQFKAFYFQTGFCSSHVVLVFGE
jgi:hypothetical protein